MKLHWIFMHSKKNEQYWANAFRQGNEEALRHMFDLYYLPMRYFAQRLVDNQHQAEDIVSEAFLKLWKQHDKYYQEKAIRAFLFVVIKNASYSYLKKEQRRLLDHQQFQYWLEHFHQQVTDEITFVTTLQHIYAQIEQFPAQRRKVCDLILLNGNDVAEVAHQLGINEQTVRNHKAIAIKQLRVSVMKKEPDFVW